MEATIKITYDKQKVTIDEIDYWVENPVYFTYSEMEKLDPDNAYLRDGKVTDELQKAIDERIDRDVKQPFIDSIVNKPEYIEPPKEDYLNIITSREAEIEDLEEKMTLYGGHTYTDEEKKAIAEKAMARAEEMTKDVEYTKEELEKMKIEAEKKVSDLTAVISTKPIIIGKDRLIEDKP